MRIIPKWILCPSDSVASKTNSHLLACWSSNMSHLCVQDDSATWRRAAEWRTSNKHHPNPKHVRLHIAKRPKEAEEVQEEVVDLMLWSAVHSGKKKSLHILNTSWLFLEKKKLLYFFTSWMHFLHVDVAVWPSYRYVWVNLTNCKYESGKNYNTSNRKMEHIFYTR